MSDGMSDNFDGTKINAMTTEPQSGTRDGFFAETNRPENEVPTSEGMNWYDETGQSPEFD